MKTEIINLVNKNFDRAITENKKFFMLELIRILNVNGFTVEKEVRHPFLDNAKINLKVTKSDSECWIEIDNKSPRLRSVENIHSIMNNGKDGFIFLRNSFLNNYKFLNIDIVSARR